MEHKELFQRKQKIKLWFKYFQVIVEGCGGVGQSREHLSRLGICCREVMVSGAATGRTDVEHRVSSLQPAPGLGFFLWLLWTGANRGLLKTVIKVIKSLTRREDKAEAEERQKAEGVRCCYITLQITQERGLCLTCVSRWEGKGQPE